MSPTPHRIAPTRWVWPVHPSWANMALRWLGALAGQTQTFRCNLKHFHGLPSFFLLPAHHRGTLIRMSSILSISGPIGMKTRSSRAVPLQPFLLDGTFSSVGRRPMWGREGNGREDLEAKGFFEGRNGSGHIDSSDDGWVMVKLSIGRI